MNNEIIVSVICESYNHEAFIGKCLDGFVMQQTNFSFEVLINDDASTDKTADIVREYAEKYPDIINAIYQTENQYSKSISPFSNILLPRAQGKYIALCEGDDYWTDPYKLQKQVDFLEANPDYGLVHGDVNHLDQKSGKITKAYNRTNNIKIPNGAIFEFLMKPSHTIKTMTTCFRRDLFAKYYLSNNAIMQNDWALIDISIWLMFAYHSKIHYFDEIFATYRLLPESMSRTKNPKKLYQFHQKIYAIRSYFANNYECSEETRVMIESNKYKSMLADAYTMNDYNVGKSAIAKIKTLNFRISLKQKVMYIVLKFPFLKSIIDILR